MLVLGSGNIVHNLRRIAWGRPSGGEDWARRFDDAARDLLTDQPADVLKLAEHPDYPLAVPTPDHFIPLLHLAGIAAAGGLTAAPFADGCVYGSLSMTSYAIGWTPPLSEARGAATGDARLGTDAPLDQANI